MHLRVFGLGFLQDSYRFGSGEDAANPAAGLVLDSQGNMYGTHVRGRRLQHGHVFEVDTTGNETVLHSFGETGEDGANPYFGGVVLDAQGNLYGTTVRGGAYGAGTVFKLDTTGNETVLYSFTGAPDGAPRECAVCYADGWNSQQGERLRPSKAERRKS